MGLAIKVWEKFQGEGCHGQPYSLLTEEKGGKIAIVGSPNVGKSVLFHRLTGTYVTVSNYPGTTVEVSRGKGTIGEDIFEVIDTPGMYSLLPVTEEERVARSILLQERPDIILHVVDAKNLERMLPLTLQLLETVLPLVLVLNIMDEAERLGMQFDLSLLKKRLGIPVVATISTTGQGIDDLREVILERGKESYSPNLFPYEEPMENLLKELESMIRGDYEISRRSLATLIVQEDYEALNLARDKEKDYPSISSAAERT